MFHKISAYIQKAYQYPHPSPVRSLIANTLQFIDAESSERPKKKIFCRINHISFMYLFSVDWQLLHTLTIQQCGIPFCKF